MYGIVTKAIEGLVLAKADAATWERIKAEAGVTSDTFVFNEFYPDEVVYKIVAAAAKVFGQTSEEILIMFGEHWVAYTAAQGMDEVLRACGRDLGSFLRALPDLHSRLSLMFPQMRMPIFTTRDLGPNHFELTYRSPRPGLSPMVHGLLKGLAARFNVRLDVSVERLGTDAEPVHRFQIKVA